MSKRHQSSRRRSYGRRQHELRERTERASRPTSAEFDLRRDDGRGRRVRVPRPRPRRPPPPLRGRRLVAVYQGARARPTLPPSRRAVADAPTLARPARSRTAVRARRRPGRVGIMLGGIALAFLLAFFSLVQSVRVSATGYEIDRLGNEQRRSTPRARS